MIISNDKQITDVIVNYLNSVDNKESTNIFPKLEVNFYCKNNKLPASIDLNDKLVLDKLQNLTIN